MSKRLGFIAILCSGVLLVATFLFFTARPAPKTFRSDTHQFQFQYPAQWNARCCRMDGPFSAAAQHLITLADTQTVRADAPTSFNGVAIFVDGNRARVPFAEYVAHEQDDFIAARLGLGWRSFPINTRNAFKTQEGHASALTLGNRQGVLLQNAANDSLSRIYVPLADARILIVTAPLGQNPAWDVELNTLLSSFRFE